ncbi:MAG: hypothetical protein M1290_03935 [Candidatus Thermoplasmatota archaeon]|jgi:hypothetical protein|nr:hypothetical protein [Candidatus Thermoplasmatota archaeon]MCL5789599.1 hypothetical protein [Candidatus Thermoplasmatota archaeon]
MTGKGNVKINVWINEERLDALRKAGLDRLAKEEFAGMMLLEVTCTEEQKDKLLEQYPTAKYDSSTTHSIELLPREVKDKIFETSLQLRSTGPEVIENMLSRGGGK